MLYQTLFQGKVFLIMLYYGIISGLILEIKILTCKIFNSKLLNILLDFVIGIIFGFLFIKSVNMFNYGEFRIYLLIAYCIGIIIEHKTLGNLVEKLLVNIYTLFAKLINKLKSKKVFSKIFK